MFSAPTWHLIAQCNSKPRGSGPLFWPPCVLQAHGTQPCTWYMLAKHHTHKCNQEPSLQLHTTQNKIITEASGAKMNNLLQAPKGLHGLAFNVLQVPVGSIKAACHPVISVVYVAGVISHNAWIFISSQELKLTAVPYYRWEH